MTRSDIKALWRKHGGSQHGPIVEHYTIEEQAFYRFAEGLLEAHHAELVILLRDLVYGGGGSVWTRARELLARVEQPTPAKTSPSQPTQGS